MPSGLRISGETIALYITSIIVHLLAGYVNCAQALDDVSKELELVLAAALRGSRCD